MIRGSAIPNKRIITSGPGSQREAQRPAPATPVTREIPTESEGEGSSLSGRPAVAADLPWLQTWAAHLGLPAPRSRRVRSFILLKGSQRVGYMAVRDDTVETGRGREPILWIVSAFLIPSLRGQGLILKFGEILSRQYYQKGKVGCRVAADNTRMMRLVARGGWTKLQTTRRFTDFMLELDSPFRATRRG